MLVIAPRKLVQKGLKIFIEELTFLLHKNVSVEQLQKLDKIAAWKSNNIQSRPTKLTSWREN